MEMKIYSIKDTKVAFKSPFMQHNDAVAVRMLKNAVNDAQNPSELSRNPEDHELWSLGTFNDVTGEIISDVKFIAKASDLKEVK